MKKQWISFLLFNVFLLCSRVMATPIDTANFTQESYASSLGQITSMAWAPDGSNRLFLTIKDGAIRIIQNGSLLPTPFKTFAPYTNSECGVLSLVFDPNYNSNGFVYVFYTVSSSVQRIVRLTDNSKSIPLPAVVNLGIDQVTLVDNLPTRGNNHDGGALAILPDEAGQGHDLYWAIGDQGPGIGQGGDMSTLASKIGRANLDGSPENTNPFYVAGLNTLPQNYIWARGFRNPFTMIVDPTTQKLWVNVVGTSYEQVFQINKGDYAGDSTHENMQPEGVVATANSPAVPSLIPKIRYRTGGTDSRVLTATGAQRSNGSVSFSTESTHRFKLGEKITIAGVSDNSFNGSVYVASIPTPTSFTAAQAGANATSGLGTATTALIGNCITGGDFYNATSFPTNYRGNFFWGDYGTGRIMRATLNSAHTVTQVDEFLISAGNVTDTSIGPDGALYFATLNGNVSRVRYTPTVATSQTLVLSASSVNLTEGGQASFSVRLGTAPNANVSVSVAKVSGDASVSISSAATLTFTPTNYATPQSVQLAASEDINTAAGNAVIRVSTSGVADQNVNIALSDNDTLSLVLSQNTVSIIEGQSQSLQVSLSHQPSATVVVSSLRSAGDTDVSITSGSSLIFGPTNYNLPQTLSIAAASDADSTNDSATLSLSSAGITTRTLAVMVVDNNSSAPTISSAPITNATQGNLYQYDVQATGLPAPTFSLQSPPSGMTINATSGLISWTPTSVGTFGVNVQASNGVNPAAIQSFNIIVLADQAPTCDITAPLADVAVSGTSAEFYGNGHDDVRTVRAEFYIDNVLKYTDNSVGGHYHMGGSHALWNTTLTPDGTHTLKMTVYDNTNKSGVCQVQIKIENKTAPKVPRNLIFTPGN